VSVATQLVILSGKGGTGKTSFTASFAHLASDTNLQGPNILVDADVDAANLSLLLDPQNEILNDFMGGSIAFINSDLSIGCGDCAEVCRYDALGPDPKDESVYLVDPIELLVMVVLLAFMPVRSMQSVWSGSKKDYGLRRIRNGVSYTMLNCSRVGRILASL